MKDLVVIEQLPEVPADWNYEESIARVKKVIYKWKNLTLELATELYIAREVLTLPASQKPRSASGTFVTLDKTWSDYCKGIGSSRKVVDEWLRRWFGSLKKGVTRVTPLLPEGKFDVVYADPPWRYEFSETEPRSIEAHYNTLSLEEICSYKDGNGIPVQEKFTDDAVLFLWATQPKIREALQVIEDWGFEYRTGAVWVKDKFGMGYYFREQHELLFVAKKGDIAVPRPEDRPTSIINAPREQHSRKPLEVHRRIEKMYPRDRYLEIFGREKYSDKWEVVGLEVKEKA